jgi:hypothetical protein
MASSLCEIPMPSRTTRKSTRPEPQIDPWLSTCNRHACQFQKPIDVVATKPRWSRDAITRDLTQDQRATKQNRTPRIADRGWKSRKSFSTSGQGRKMFLTSPLIEQAITRFELQSGILSVMAMFRQSTLMGDSGAGMEPRHGNVRSKFLCRSYWQEKSGIGFDGISIAGGGSGGSRFMQ